MSTPNNVHACLLEAVTPYLDQPLWIAFSGGLDSTVLCHALSVLRIQHKLDITLLHINHQLNSDADHWAQHCQSMANQWDLPFECVTLDSKPHGASIENWARQQRRHIFADKLTQGGVVITAHHQDDQAETLLFRLLRGTGPDGLAAMRACSPLANGQILRPFLSISRQTLAAYAQAHQLPWMEDPSNQDTVFTRNYLRHKVMPVLQQQWPKAEYAISRCADLCAEQRDVLESYLAQDLSDIQQGTHQDQLPLTPWQTLPAAKQRMVLRYWLYQQTGFYLTQKQVHQVIHDVIHAQVDAKPLYQLGQIQCRRYQHTLYLVPPLATIDPYWSETWNGEGPLKVPGWSQPLTKTMLAKQGVDCDAVDWQRVTVRFRKLGERVHLQGRTQTYALKKILQEHTIPPWVRDRVPLVFEGDVLLSIAHF